MIVIASIAMFAGIMAHHLGLTETAARIVLKISRCVKCVSFWVVFFTLLLSRIHPLAAIGASLLCAYIAIWVELILFSLTKIYNSLWERLNK